MERKSLFPKILIQGILFSLYISMVASAQSSHIDSLQSLLRQPLDDTLRWEVLKNITEYYIQNHPDSAEYYAEKCLRLAEDKLPEKRSLSYTLWGAYYTENQNYLKASEVLHKALNVAKAENCLTCKLEVLNELFLISYDQQDYDKALGFLKENYRTAYQLEDSLLLAKAATNLSLVYGAIPQNDSAAFYAYKGIEIAKAIQAHRYIRYCYNNLGIIHENKKEYTKAVENFKEVARYAAKAGDKEMEATGYFNVASSSILEGHLDTAALYLERAKQRFEELKRKDLLAYYYEGISEFWALKNDHEKALAYFKRATALRDSLQKDMYGKNLAEAETKFNTSEKEAQLAEQALIIERQSNNQKNILIGSILVFLLLFALFQYFRHRQKIKAGETQLALQLEHAEAKKLREIDQMKSTFFANISHEFRTPLTLIKTPLQDLIKGNNKDKDHVQKYYRIMNRNADRLLSLVNQLLDLAKLESGKMQLQATEEDIVQLVRTLTWSFESLAAKKDIRLTLDVPNAPVWLWLDKDKVEKILANLLSNAFKFTSGEGCVSVTLLVEEAEVVIQVSDTGIGLPNDQLEHIFERFYQSAHTSDLQASSGIGLALTKELVELHGGIIEVVSQEGVGSTFTVKLLRGSAHLMPEDMSKTAHRYQSSPPVFAKKNKANQPLLKNNAPPTVIQETLASVSNLPLLLIVEDNADVRTYIRDRIGSGYKIMEAENGRLGLDIALEQIPDLILSDVMMPEMDGTEMCRQLKSNDKTSHIPIIMLTARSDQSDKLEGLHSGADDYLTKPFDGEELKVRIDNLIQRQQQMRKKFKLGHPFQSTGRVVSSVDEVFLKKVMKSIEDNLDDEDFSIEQLAKGVSMSRSQLHRKIKALSGLSPSVFLRTIRLDRGKQLLEQKAGNASEVAFMVGFSSTTYFATCFKEQFGLSPSEV